MESENRCFRVVGHPPPLMITATLDDGLGQGLEVIRMFSETAGLEIIELGLLVTPDKIITACKKNEPDLLGLPILQFDVEACPPVAWMPQIAPSKM